MPEEKKEENQSKHRKYSMILDKFPKDVLIELNGITMLSCDNNTKCVRIRETLKRNGIQYEGLGSGTNRYGINMPGPTGMLAVKIALDSDGMIDNRREFKYGPQLYPYVCKVYECLEDGLVAVFEYVTPFTLGDLHRFEDQIREILRKVSNEYMIGDVGISEDNYKNWGIRMVNGKEEICMLDFAYVYAISYKLFTCNCDGITLVQYDDDYVGLYCPRCHKKYTFAHIRRKVTRKDQEMEIGNIKDQGYELHDPVELVDDVEEFMPFDKERKKQEKKKKRLTERERIRILDDIQNHDPYGDIYNRIYNIKGENENE